MAQCMAGGTIHVLVASLGVDGEQIVDQCRRDKSLVSDEVIINTVVNKYCDHAPLYRQSVALLRDAGIDISRATMCGWVMTIGEMLMPDVGAMRSQLLAGTYIQAR